MDISSSINEAFWLFEDDEFRRSFLFELHQYLKDQLPKNRADEYPKTCTFASSCTHCACINHFETFCISREVQPDVARHLFRLMYGPSIDCDWEYFQQLKVTEEDPEPRIEWRW